MILLSQEACSSGGLLHGTSHAPRPIQISFPGYSPAELISVRTAAERAAQAVPSSLHRSEPARMDCSSQTRQLHGSWLVAACPGGCTSVCQLHAAHGLANACISCHCPCMRGSAVLHLFSPAA